MITDNSAPTDAKPSLDAIFGNNQSSNISNNDAKPSLDEIFGNSQQSSDGVEEGSPNDPGMISNIRANMQQEGQPTAPETPINSPEFLPQAGTEVTRGLLQSGESLANIAQGVTNLATAPFTAIGVRSPQIFKQASDYLSGLESNLPQTNINPVGKFALNVAGGAAIGVGEYSAANAAIKGLGELSTAGRGLNAASKVLANPALDEGTKAAMASSLVSQNEGLASLPMSQKIVEGFLTHPVFSEGTKMALISALNEYGQTDEAKSLLKGGAEGFKYGTLVGAGGKLFDKAVDLMKENGTPAAKAFLQATVGNEEVTVNGKKMKIADAVEKYPDMFSANVNPYKETAEEFNSRMKEELSQRKQDGEEQLAQISKKSAEVQSKLKDEFDALRQQSKDNRQAIEDSYSPKIENLQAEKKSSLFNASESSQIEREANTRIRENDTSDKISEIQNGIAKMKNNVQISAEELLSEQKAQYEAMIKQHSENIGQVENDIANRFPGVSDIPFNETKQKVANALAHKTELGFNPIGIKDYGIDSEEALDANVGAGLNAPEGQQPNFVPSGLFKVGSNVPGIAENDVTSYLNKAMQKLHQIAGENNGKVPLGVLKATRDQVQSIFDKIENSKAKGYLKPIVSKLYRAFSPADYLSEDRPWLKSLADANKEFHSKADIYKAVHDLSFDSKGNPTPNRILESFEENSTLSRSFRKAEQNLPESLRISSKIDDLSKKSKDYINESTKTIKTTQNALNIELKDFGRKQARSLYNLNKSYDERLKTLKSDRDTAIQKKKFEDVAKINQKRLELLQWKNTQTKAIQDAGEIYKKEMKSAHDAASEQYSKMKAQELLSGAKVGSKSGLKYPQNYLGFHALFDMFSNPIKAGAYAGASGLLSPRLALNIYKISRNTKLPTGISAPASVLKNMLQHPKVREQIATHLSTMKKQQR